MNRVGAAALAGGSYLGLGCPSLLLLGRVRQAENKEGKEAAGQKRNTNFETGQVFVTSFKNSTMGGTFSIHMIISTQLGPQFDFCASRNRAQETLFNFFFSATKIQFICVSA